MLASSDELSNSRAWLMTCRHLVARATEKWQLWLPTRPLCNRVATGCGDDTRARGLPSTQSWQSASRCPGITAGAQDG